MIFQRENLISPLCLIFRGRDVTEVLGTHSMREREREGIIFRGVKQSELSCRRTFLECQVASLYTKGLLITRSNASIFRFDNKLINNITHPISLDTVFA